jgi:hypothetical protein
MTTIHTNDSAVEKIGRAAYPDYKGRKFRVKVVSDPINVKSYWDGGSCSFYRFIKLADADAVFEVPAQHPMFDAQIKGADAVNLVPGLACVKHSIFCGKDMGLDILIHPENAPRLLPAKVDLTDDEKIVLEYTSGYKPCYAGRSNNRLYEAHRETQITEERWSSAKASLIAKGLLDKRGALTNEGRNNVPSRY